MRSRGRCLVKDEAHFDRFDLAFAAYFKGVSVIFDVRATIPEEWLRKEFERHLTPEDRARIEALGGWDKLMETFKQRLAEQKGRHAGGSKWIGTGGTSPFGAYGFNPEGIRIGQEGGGSRSAVKVWDERSFRNLDGDVELNTRNIKVALRKLRRFAREGVPEELDLEGTIEGTARNAGWLDLHMVPERRNRVKVLLFLDVGGSKIPARARVRGAVLGGEERSPATSSTSTSTTASTTTSGKTTAAATSTGSPRRTSCTSTAPTGSSSSSATPR